MLCFLLGLNRQSVTNSYLAGSIWETLCFGELRELLRLSAPEASLWYYRDQSREVDSVIDKGGLLTLAEAKWKELPTQRDFVRALRTQPLLKRVTEPLLALCRTPQSFPIATNLLAVNAFKLRQHL